MVLNTREISIDESSVTIVDEEGNDIGVKSHQYDFDRDHYLVMANQTLPTGILISYDRDQPKISDTISSFPQRKSSFSRLNSTQLFMTSRIVGGSTRTKGDIKSDKND